MFHVRSRLGDLRGDLHHRDDNYAEVAKIGADGVHNVAISTAGSTELACFKMTHLMNLFKCMLDNPASPGTETYVAL